MVQSVEEQPAYVLHRRPYQNSSLILDLFTLNHGRLSVVAKGAMRGKRNWSGLLQMFQPILVSWAGRSNLKSLVNVEAHAAAFSLQAEGLYCGFYLNELLLKLTPEMDANPRLFVCYGNALQQLHDQPHDRCHTEVALRRFEFQLLTLLGHAPDFEFDGSGHSIRPEQLYCLAHDRGFAATDNRVAELQHAANISKQFEGSILKLFTDGWLAELGEVEPITAEHSSQLRAAKRLMRHLIDQVLQGRELKSRELFRQIKRG